MEYSFKTDLPVKNINCFINNEAKLKTTKGFDDKVILSLSRLKIGNRYRINCTYKSKNGDIFWNGKMFKRID